MTVSASQTKREKVTVYEVGPRDGLQNERVVIPATSKIRFVNSLAAAGLSRVEVTSFVRPGAIPQLADAAEVYQAVEKVATSRFSALVPNARGMEAAISAQVQEVAVFTAASETFTQRNINCTIEESFARFADVFKMARDHSIPVRGYVSTIVECPYEGRVSPESVARLTKRLLDEGCYQVSLGETIGTAVPDEIARLLDAVLLLAPAETLAGHFHDTRGTALANAARALEYGLRTFDSSAGGLGGCPYAPGAAGNLATEDLVYYLFRSGYDVGVDLDAIARAAGELLQELGRPSTSRVHRALQALQEKAVLN